MLNEIARVFSSNGVLIPGSDYTPVQNRKAAAEKSCDHKGADCKCFGPKFDQASAKLELSKAGKDKAEAGAAAAQEAGAAAAQEAGAAEQGGSGANAGKDAGAAAKKGADGKPLSEDEQKAVQELAKRDREVKAHEAAHQASSGGHAKGGANYDYQTGPDGRQYAVGGHVDIDASPVKGNPEATLQKAQTVQRAALAPADPSGQDRSVAAAAAQMAMQAQREIAEQKNGAGEAGKGGEEGEGGGEESGRQGGDQGAAAAETNGNAGAIRSARIRSYGKAQPPAGGSFNVVG